jgi:hypothetical protein
MELMRKIVTSELISAIFAHAGLIDGESGRCPREERKLMRLEMFFNGIKLFMKRMRSKPSLHRSAHENEQYRRVKPAQHLN